MIYSGIYFDVKANESRPYCVDTSYNQAFAVMPKSCGIYAISGSKPITEERVMYIGQAQDMAHRISQHFCAIRKGYHDNPIVTNTVTKYGEEDYTFYCLEACDVANADDREQNWLDFYNDSYPGALMNVLTVATSCRGHRHSEEAKLKMSAAKKGKPISESHKKNIELAQKRMTNETREKRSKAAKAMNPEIWKNLAEINKGHKYNLGKTHTKRQRHVWLTDKNGRTLFTDKGFTAFAKEHGIKGSSGFSKVANGKKREWCGWRLATEQEIASVLALTIGEDAAAGSN